MSLTHLLEAITAQANDKIAAFTRASEERLTAAKSRHETTLQERRASILSQVEERKTLLRSKSETHAQLSRRTAVLQARHQLIDDVFATVLDTLVALPDQKVEPLLRHLLSSLPKTGTVLPAKKHVHVLQTLLHGSSLHLGEAIQAKGGFIFQSDTFDRTCTFEHLVLTEMRNAKELWVSRELSKSS